MVGTHKAQLQLNPKNVPRRSDSPSPSSSKQGPPHLSSSSFKDASALRVSPRNLVVSSRGAPEAHPCRASLKGRRPGETPEKMAARVKANSQAFEVESAKLQAELNELLAKDKTSPWRPPKKQQKRPFNAREQANVAADAPWEAWHDLLPILEGVDVPEWGPKPVHKRGFNYRNFIGPLQQTVTEYDVDFIYFPRRSPRPHPPKWKFWASCGALEFVFGLVLLLIILMIVFVATGENSN